MSPASAQAMEAGEIDEADPELLAWALMGIGELVGMRWILWAGRDELPADVLERARARSSAHDRLDGTAVTTASGSPRRPTTSRSAG